MVVAGVAEAGIAVVFWPGSPRLEIAASATRGEKNERPSIMVSVAERSEVQGVSFRARLAAQPLQQSVEVFKLSVLNDDPASTVLVLDGDFQAE